MNKKSDNGKNQQTRRRFIKTSVVGGTAAMLLSNGMLYGKSPDKIKVGLIGCGGRGTRAGIIDCAESSPGVELVAIGDVFEDHVKSAPETIKTNLQKRGLPVKDIYKVTPETTFAGFDAYKNVIACDVDMVILTTPPFFRPEHLRAAVEAGKHVFVEKPVAVDPVGVRSVIESSDLALEKGLAIVAGTQLRRILSNRETIKRVHNGDIGDLTGGQVVRSGGAMRDWRSEEETRKPEWSDMEYHIRRWLFWTWQSGDFITEMHVHNLDIMNWILGSHPVQCMGVGGRQVRTEAKYGDCYDHFAVEYEYPNDVRIEYIGTQIDGFTYRSDQRVTGTQGSVYLYGGNGIIKGANPWKFEGEKPNPSVLQYAEMIDSIRKGKPLNEGRQVAESTMTAILGRMSAYTGRALKWDWAMNASKLDLTPGEMKFGDLPDMPVPMPGVTELI
ncbi:MAG: Gfo/Idh/MocA family oxidoreductase [Bacteroidales bacterium]|jgi:predicted dehydrogenase